MGMVNSPVCQSSLPVSPVAQAAANWAGACWRCHSPHRWWFPGPCWSPPTPVASQCWGAGLGPIWGSEPKGRPMSFRDGKPHGKKSNSFASRSEKLFYLCESCRTNPEFSVAWWFNAHFVSINEDYHRIIYNPKHQPVQVVTKVWLLADPLLNWVGVWISLCKPIQSHRGCNPSRMVNGWLVDQWWASSIKHQKLSRLHQMNVNTC